VKFSTSEAFTLCALAGNAARIQNHQRNRGNKIRHKKKRD